MARKPIGYVPDMGAPRPIGQGTASIGGSSGISTAGPFTAGHMAQYGKPKPAARQYGGGSGDRSRDAFARAGSQQAGNVYTQQMEDTNRQYQKKAEQARSADVYAQRADTARRFGMDESYKADKRGIALSRREDMRNIGNRLDEMKRNTDLERRNSMINLAFGGGLLSSGGNVMTARARGTGVGGSGFGGNSGWGNAAFGSGGGVLGGILGGMVGGPGGAMLGATAGNSTGKLLSSLFA